MITNMKFEDDPDYDALIETMRVLDVYDDAGRKIETRRIEDDELRYIDWNHYIHDFKKITEKVVDTGICEIKLPII